jgi:hypothetical protein
MCFGLLNVPEYNHTRRVQRVVLYGIYRSANKGIQGGRGKNRNRIQGTRPHLDVASLPHGRANVHLEIPAPSLR